MLGEGVVGGEDRRRPLLLEQGRDPLLGVRRVERDAQDQPLVNDDPELLVRMDVTF